jgi:hypothetical protein
VALRVVARGIAAARARDMACRLLVLVALAGCAARPRRDLHVVAYAPQGAIDVAEPISVRFDRPVVGDAQVGKLAAPGLVSIAPAVHATAVWQDRQTLVVRVAGGLAPSTRYEVALAGELGARAGHFAFGFVHAPLSVDGVWGLDTDDLPPGGDLPLSFNQPVVPREAAAHCRLAAADGGTIALVAHGDAPAASVALSPAAPLVPGARYTLSCVGLTGAGGNAPLAQPYSLALRARPRLDVAGVTPKGDAVAADRATIAVAFTTPVALEAVRAALSSVPAIPGLDAGALSPDGRTYTVTADLAIQTDYAITVRDLVDTAGQTLAHPVTARFHTGDARPRLAMERGVVALEASANGYPVWSRDVASYTVACAAIPKTRLVRLLTARAGDATPIDWKSLGVTPRIARHEVAPHDAWQLDELDLGAMCGRGPGARGVYLAEVGSDEVAPHGSRVVADVTELGALLETGRASGLVWVTSLATGAPVAGARVTVLTAAGKQVVADLTNAEGLVRLPGSAERLIAIVEKGGDVAVVDGSWGDGRQAWSFGVPHEGGGGPLLRGFIQSDRALYRPGETAHFMGVVRAIDPARGLRVPAAAAVALEVTDGGGRTVKQLAAHLSPFGGFAFDVALPGDAALGTYQLAATIGGETIRDAFEVGHVRPDAFELALAPEAPRGGRLAFALDARYRSGAPVPNAKVAWHLRRRAHRVEFPGYAAYAFDAAPEAPEADDVSDGDDATDAQGHLAIASRDDEPALAGPVDYVLTAAVTDAADRTIARSVVETAHAPAFYLGIATGRVQAVGTPFDVGLVALAPDGARVATAAHLALIRLERSCTGNVPCEQARHTMLERDVALAASGAHVERIAPAEPGDYVVRLEAKDAAGAPVVAQRELWVTGDGDARWSTGDGDRMTVIASAPAYVPGETARLVPEADLVAPTALVTIERDGILDARVVKLKRATEGIDLTIAASWAPDVFASVALVSGRHGDGDAGRPRFAAGTVELAVSPQHARLDVAIALDRAIVHPGERVTGTIRVTRDGKPVSAEVSLSAADDLGLRRSGYATPDPMAAFYAPYGLGVDAATSWNHIARRALPEAADPDATADAAPPPGVERVRGAPAAPAVWAPMLVTDARGQAAFSFIAPDDRSTYRLMAVAADRGAHFGAGEQRLIVRGRRSHPLAAR